MSLQLGGLVGGLVATVVMTALMMAMGDDSPPPTAQVWAKYVGDGLVEEYPMQGMILHLRYGIGAGWVFALVAAFGLLALTPPNLVDGVINGAVYGIILVVVAAVVWMRLVLGMEPDAGTLGGFTLMHVVYGVVLGAFLGLGGLV
jgi:hypothetical protein